MVEATHQGSGSDGGPTRGHQILNFHKLVKAKGKWLKMTEGDVFREKERERERERERIKLHYLFIILLHYIRKFIDSYT